MKEYYQYLEKNGSYTDKKTGVTFALIQEAYIDGQDDLSYYTAIAIDQQGIVYTLTWKIIDKNCEDQTDACNWNNFEFKKLGKFDL